MFLKFVKNLSIFLILIIFIVFASILFYFIDLSFTKPGSSNAQNSTRQRSTGNVNDDLTDKSSFLAALHFVFSLISTIGYGDVVPQTVQGRILSILTAVLGIPLCLTCLAIFGKHLEKLLTTIWCKVARGNSTKTNFTTLTSPSPPLILGLCLTFLWILFSSVYFYSILKSSFDFNDDFTFFTACYFTVITFLTIGYGEYYPGRYDYIFLTMLFVFVGLALMTMCIEIVQTNIEKLFDEIDQSIDQNYKINLISNDQPTDRNRKLSFDRYSTKRIQKFIMRDLMSKKEGQNRGVGKKFLYAFMGQKEKERLAEKFVKRSSMVNKAVQVDIDKKDGESQAKVAKSDRQIQVDRKWNSARKWETVKIAGKVRHMFD